MEDADFQPDRLTASPESPDIDWDVLGQLPLLDDILSPEVAIDPSNATTSTPTTNTIESQGAMVGLDADALDELFSGAHSWGHVATIASSSTSHFAAPSTSPLLDATANMGAPASRNASLIQPSISIPARTTASQGHLLSPSGYSPWPKLPSYDETITRLRTAIQAGSSSSVRERVTQALTYIRETGRYNNVLAQLWVPVIMFPNGLYLTTIQQPFAVDQSSDILVRFSNVSRRMLLPARLRTPLSRLQRVFMGKLPEWSEWSQGQDVGYYTSYETPIRNFGVRGALGLPVFEKGNNSCLGVIDLVSVTSEISFASELDTICSALQAVNLTTTHVSSIPRTMFNSASQKDALLEILCVLRAACVIHKLPLAQTWATCAQQGKRGRRHSDENYLYCVSTIDAACYVNDPQMWIFHEACSKQHLMPGQGVAGKAFTSNQPCFLADIGTSSEQEYPLSQHAKTVGLKGAVAIRLRCTRTGVADFVLEFFLPTCCEIEKEQKAMLDSLSRTMRKYCGTLRMVTNKEMQDEAMWVANELKSFGSKKKKVIERKPMARRSPVWKSFTEIIVGDTAKAKCKHCCLELRCSSKNGTSSLISHLKRCKLNPDNRITGPL